MFQEFSAVLNNFIIDCLHKDHCMQTLKINSYSRLLTGIHQSLPTEVLKSGLTPELNSLEDLYREVKVLEEALSYQEEVIPLQPIVPIQ